MTDLSATTLHEATATAQPSRAADYVALLKPRVMSLVVFTGMVGLWLAPGSIHPVLGAVAIVAIALGAGASGAINMWYDRDIDAVMTRTRNRPIPTGAVAPDDALGFGVLVFLIMLIEAAVRRRPGVDNPWGEGATTLEWTLSSPPPHHQFNELPVVKSDEH